MKKKTEPSVATDWLEIARKDWKRIGRNLRARDLEASAFFLQQCLEKYLKAFLLSHQWRLRRVHKLDALLDEAVKHQADLENFRDLCERVSGYYFAERYPPLGTLDLGSEDLKRDLKEARRFVDHMFPGERLGR